MPESERLSSGVPGLDERLGGGLVPGTLTVLLGATGIGKTQLGIQFAAAGRMREGTPGVIFDMTARLDSQNHADYANRIADWSLTEYPRRPFSPAGYFDESRAAGTYLHIFDQRGRRVTARDLDFDAWHDWQAELAAKLNLTIDFFYGNFVRGVRRVVIDGIEPADRQSESVQHELFEYVFHQVLRKEATWVARDLFRESYRAHAAQIERHAYECGNIASLLLVTSHETMLDELIARPLSNGDLLAAANTVIYMGKVREGGRLLRGLYIAKHRGSACSDEIAHYTIGERGLTLE
ncbi:MAG TPA: ATPase domain-containing protein [Pirellulales bacterium]|jgi:KaiC/GvpD/RAD55 family RecA-like ATPase|nr:ATPase domain-containing protein [Pirellulales bacterium]